MTTSKPSVIIDPITMKHALTNPRKTHENYFGVHIPYVVLKELLNLSDSSRFGETDLKYNHSGYIRDHIFESDEATEHLIQHIQQHKNTF